MIKLDEILSAIKPFCVGWFTDLIGIWIDYSDYSTITGWSSTVTKIIRYKKAVTKTVTVVFEIVGTSNNTATTFTLPYAVSAAYPGSIDTLVKITDNATRAVGLCRLAASSATVTFYATLDAGLWTASGDKLVQGQFCYESA
jgi:hypothetical protein